MTEPTPPAAAPRRVVVAGLGDTDELPLVRRARVLRDDGVEVIWVGSGLQAEQVAAVAVAEDADAVEVAPTTGAPEVERALAQREAADIDVVPVRVT
ncbi:hypothetical protein [Aeromicrobium alkaliterrae]|uniref:B12-binding domain-containing protein n=1 Tax=Aeromicrobium alkaliterrae TaxID=302168 RepID=A0ABN2KBI9_9ACTN